MFITGFKRQLKGKRAERKWEGKAEFADTTEEKVTENTYKKDVDRTLNESELKLKCGQNLFTIK